MKEKFENRTLTGSIKIKMDDAKGIWYGDKKEIVDAIISIAEEYDNDGYVLTMGDIKFLTERIKHLQKLQKTAWIDKSLSEHTELNDRVLRLKQWRKELSVKQENKSFKNLSGAFKNLQPATCNGKRSRTIK